MSLDRIAETVRPPQARDMASTFHLPRTSNTTRETLENSSSESSDTEIAGTLPLYNDVFNYLIFLVLLEINISLITPIVLNRHIGLLFDNRYQTFNLQCRLIQHFHCNTRGPYGRGRSQQWPAVYKTKAKVC